MAETLPKEEAIFHAALEIDAADRRSAYLDAACGGQDELRRRVEALLRRHAGVEGPLDRPVISLAATADKAVAEQAGTVIGPYKLLEQIGEGGMGLVFVAEQQRPVKRRVALKVIKPGMDSRQVIARFEAERQALALMDHPHIAKVHDGGATDAGRPYFVMELVRGTPITDFCDSYRLTTRQRLELFLDVCHAVQHAHQKGVIHRDLKPSNVLVELHDVRSVAKVIDFGIAKAIGQQLTDKTVYTQFAQLVGTPLYMSPEQAEMSGLDVDTRSDVYSLGALLYELLTGTTPFAGKMLKRVGLDEMRRLIREEEPPTPSQRLNTLNAQTCSTVSERRGVDVRRLGQLLRGELDWIVMRALEKDRDRRYESASAFAADVQRYLADEAVEACPPSAGYRLRKYVRRHQRALATVGVVSVALVAATAVSTWQAVDANAARKLADERLDNEKEARKAAATESAVAQAVNDFLQQDLLGQVNSDPQFPDEFGGKSRLTVKEALDRAAAKIGDRFRDQPLAEAAVRTAIGQAYRSLTEQAPAVPQLERALVLRQTHLGTGHPDTLASMDTLASAYQWVARYGEAITLSHQLLDDARTRLGQDHPETLARAERVAECYRAAREWDTSIRLHEQVLEKQRAVFGPTHPSTLGTMHRLAMNYDDAGRFAESIALHERVLDNLRSVNGREYASTSWPMLSYAQVCQRAGNFDRADQLLREYLEHMGNRDGSRGHRQARANALTWLALNLTLQQRYSEAEPLAREALDYYEKELPGNPTRFIRVSLLGAVLLGQQRFAEAEPLLLQGYEGLKRGSITYHLKHWWIIEAGERVARFYQATNQLEKAQELREELRSSSGFK
jgi:serine/threonine protein kinase/tetratricopeptide (TPR) repeat protein